MRKRKRKGLEIINWIKLIGYVASILVASTSLLSASGNVPAWWFDFSLIFLLGLIFSVPFMVFAKPISKRFKSWKLERKRNTITQKHFAEFRNLMDTSATFNYTISRIEDSLRTHYKNDIKSSLARHILQSNAESETRNTFFEIEKRLKESNKTFRDLSLIMRHLKFCLDIYTRHLKTIEVFVHEMMSKKEKPIAKGIEAEFESFREKYNYFVKDFKDYCRKVNQELGEIEFPEWIIDYVKKW